MDSVCPLAALVGVHFPPDLNDIVLGYDHHHCGLCNTCLDIRDTHNTAVLCGECKQVWTCKECFDAESSKHGIGLCECEEVDENGDCYQHECDDDKCDRCEIDRETCPCGWCEDCMNGGPDATEVHIFVYNCKRHTNPQ
jgi:hypothetical protein